MSATLKIPWRFGARAWTAIALTMTLVAGSFLMSSGTSAAAPARATAPVRAAVPTPTPVPTAAPIPLPTPFRFTSFLDLECFKTSAYVPPTTTLLTRHLNPVLAGLPTEPVTLGPRQQLCVPVMKNSLVPPPDVLNFVRFVDLSCYAIQGLNVNRPLNLRHLNPLLQGLPPRNVVITVPQQLCVPVIKNGVVPPPEVLRLVSYVDLKCYVEQPQVSLNFGLQLSHLNPVMAGLAPHAAWVGLNRQLCVPVQKNNQLIPADVLNIVRWIDLEKFDIVTPPLPAPFNLIIKHINPLLAGLPVEPVTIQAGQQLMVPVAKNNVLPPST